MPEVIFGPRRNAAARKLAASQNTDKHRGLYYLLLYCPADAPAPDENPLERDRSTP